MELQGHKQWQWTTYIHTNKGIPQTVLHDCWISNLKIVEEYTVEMRTAGWHHTTEFRKWNASLTVHNTNNFVGALGDVGQWQASIVSVWENNHMSTRNFPYSGACRGGKHVMTAWCLLWIFNKSFNIIRLLFVRLSFKNGSCRSQCRWH